MKMAHRDGEQMEKNRARFPSKKVVTLTDEIDGNYAVRLTTQNLFTHEERESYEESEIQRTCQMGLAQRI